MTNMIQFSNGVFAEQGNVQRRVPAPLPSFNPAPETMPGIPEAPAKTAETPAAPQVPAQPETPAVAPETKAETPTQTTEEKA